MDWKKLIAELMAAGVTQAQIAETCGVAQATVSDLHRGETKSPNFDFGDRLRRLHAERVAPPSRGGRKREAKPADAPVAADPDTAMRHDLTQRSTDRILFGAAASPNSDKPSRPKER